MQKSDFFYELPEELIASEPLAERTAARLLLAAGQSQFDGRFNDESKAEDQGFQDRFIKDIPVLVDSKDLMVFNDTEVLNARLRGAKLSGGKVEILVERLLAEDPLPTFLAQIKSNKKLRPKTELVLDGGGRLTVIEKQEDGFYRLKSDGDIATLLAMHGEVPLPPYIRRPANIADKTRYQTVYAEKPGAVAAPTAGLHFDEALLTEITSRGVDIGFTTLHVGAGTFQPVRSEDIAGHQMHSEFCTVDEKLCAQIRATREHGGRIIAVGTTTARALESASASGLTEPFVGDTNIFISPGYEFKAVDVLMTNFHLPESTLIMLVSAFIGHERTLAAYKYAVSARYRFFSYGDAMWLVP